MKKELVVALIPLLAALAGCSSAVELTSRWHTGRAESKTESAVYLKDENLIADFQNDSEYIYVSLATNDRFTQQQIVRSGLTVWFDYQGGKSKRFGIHYPINVWFTPYGERHQFPGRNPDTSWTIPENLSDEIEIFGPMKDEQHRMRMEDTRGIDVKIENQNGTMYYVLQVPLMDNEQHLYGIGTHPGATIGIGVEAGSPFSRSRPESFGRGFGGGFGGGMRRPSFGGSREGFGERREPLKVWFKIHLAKTNSA